ncbi:MAG TPA: FAD-dependent oxidoreductase [Verrucomicrobiae bacterium]|nr:FAD-dependent oxidoreductase [Verrucomicrobiae bacterium]
MKSFANQLKRRDFLKSLGLATPLILAAPGCIGVKPLRPRELSADVVIIGGGMGGCAAALAAARNGLNVILTEETDWIGGQVTQQAVPPDENRWIETFGATASYQTFRTGIRDYYRKNYPLTDEARAKKYFNPGNSWVSAIGGEPRVALAALNEMLAPYVANGQVNLLLWHKAVAATTHGDTVEAVQVRDLTSGHDLILHAPYFLDATEQGDLLPLTKTEYAIGAEAKSETGELHAKDTAQPDNLQGFTMCFAMDYLAGEDHTLPKPRDYDYWRAFTFSTSAQKDYHVLNFEERDSKRIGFDPEARKGFWTYRRIADRDQFASGFYPGDLTIVNWPQNDYSFGQICDVSEAQAKKHVESAKQMSLSLLYWLQTEIERPDGGAGWKGLRLRPDVVGTKDGLAKYPYIREGRRIKAEFTVLEEHVTMAERMRITGLKKEEVHALQFADTVGIGHYAMDLHITTRGDHANFGGTLPFQIPLGALIPRRMENLLPAGKNLGVTHLTNGCYRLHPVEWNVGEAAGALAAFCVAQKKTPRQVRNQPELLADFQKLLTKDGVRLEWPKDLVMK